MAIKLGAAVRQIVQTPLEGIVMKKEFDDGADKFRFLVEWPGPQGEAPHSRWFAEDEIEGVAA